MGEHAMKKFFKIFFGIIRSLITIFLIVALLAVLTQAKSDEKYLLPGIVCYNIVWWTSNAFVHNLSLIGKREYYNPKKMTAYEDYMNSEERDFLYKIPKRTKIALTSVWLFIGIVFLYISTPSPEQPLLNAELIFPAVWCVITIAATAVIKNIERKTDKRLLGLYDEKYISTLELTDDFLGDMRFTYDSHLGSLETANLKNLNLPPFGKASPSTLSVYKYSDAEKDKIFRRLKAVYAHADKILTDASEYACDTFMDIYDLKEKPDPKPIRENAAVASIDVNSEYITLYIYIDNDDDEDFGSFEISAVIDLQNKTIDYELED